MVCPTESTEHPTHQIDRPPSVAFHLRISYKETFSRISVMEKRALSSRISSSPVQGTNLIIAGVVLVIFLFAIDATIVSAALPTVVASVGGLELYSWVFSIYMLASALSMPLFGKLSDLYGRRRLMLIGIGLFMLGSALCGAAQSMIQLILFRAVQGIGGGAINSLSFIIVGVVFPPEKRSRMQGVISSVWGVASVLGPLMGGLITQYWSWRWIFFINLPTGILAAALIVLGLHERDLERRRPRLDIKGAATLMLGLLVLFYALLRSGKAVNLFDPGLIALFAFAVATLLLFLVLERRADEPLLPLDIFRLRLFSVSTALSMVSAMGVYGFIGYLPLYVQGVLGGSPTQVGTLLIPVSLGWAAGGLMSGHGMNRFGYRTMCLVGMVLMLLGYGVLIGAGARVGVGMILVTSLLIGLGMGMVNLASLVAAQGRVSVHHIGVATTTIMLFRTFGGALGLSILGSVLFHQMRGQLLGISAGAGANISTALIEKLGDPQKLLLPSTRALIPEQLLPILTEALSNSLWYAFLAGLVIVAFGLGLSLFMADLTPASTPRSGNNSQSQS